MAEISWTEPALSDIDGIAEYIALDNPPAARALVRRVMTAVERLRDFQESGRFPPELEGERYREIIVGPCRVFYRLDSNMAWIVHIMRGERRLRRYLLEFPHG